jgi:hypothetical protein
MNPNTLNVMAAKVVVFSYYVIGLLVACVPTPAQCKLILSSTLVVSISVLALSLPLCHPQELTARLQALARFPHGAGGARASHGDLDRDVDAHGDLRLAGEQDRLGRPGAAHGRALGQGHRRAGVPPGRGGGSGKEKEGLLGEVGTE